MSRLQRQILALLLGNYLLIVIVAQANHSLAPWQMRLALGGLLVAPAALNLGFRAGATVAFVSGLALDANAPVWFGTQALLLLAAQATLYSARDRLARGETTVEVVASLLTNLGLYLALALFAGGAAADQNGWRILTDLVVSQLVLALVAPWFFAFQIRMLELAGVSLRPDER
jgi:rod shape-determining protein MreD